MFTFACVLFLLLGSVNAESYRKIPDSVFHNIQKYVNEDDQAKIIVFLIRAISEDVAEPYIRSLESAISSPGLFKGIVDEIIGDARQFVMDEQFIQDIWKDYLKSGKTEDESDTPDPETGSSSGSKLYSMAHYSSINAIQKMDQRTFNSVVRAIKNYRSYGSVAITKPLQAARFSTKV